MIQGFVKQTKELTEYESGVLLPIIVRCLKNHVGKENVITNCEMCCKMEECGYDINEARMRKIINHIRNHCLVPCLVATGKGYYVTTSVQEMKNFIESLNGRIEAITAMRDSMMQQRDVLKSKEG